MPGRHKRELVVKVISNRISELKKKADLLKQYDTVCASDCDKLKKDTLKKIKEVIISSNIELASLSYFNADTSLKFLSRYVSADRASYLKAIREEKLPIKVMARDTFNSLYEARTLTDEGLVVKKAKYQTAL